MHPARFSSINTGARNASKWRLTRGHRRSCGASCQSDSARSGASRSPSCWSSSETHCSVRNTRVVQRHAGGKQAALVWVAAGQSPRCLAPPHSGFVDGPDLLPHAAEQIRPLLRLPQARLQGIQTISSSSPRERWVAWGGEAGGPLSWRSRAGTQRGRRGAARARG